MKLRQLLPILPALLLAMTSAGLALPGQRADQVEALLTAPASLFPADRFSAGAGVIGSHKSLGSDLSLRFLAYVDQPLSAPGRGLVRQEALLLTRDRIDPQQSDDSWGKNSCDRPMHFTVALLRAFPLDGEEQSRYQRCRPTSQPDFISSRSGRLSEWLRQIYPKSPLPADFAKAKLLGKGTRYYYFAEGPKGLVRKRLTIPPISQQLWRGARFDYLLTDYSLIIAARGGLSQVALYWRQDLALLKQSAVATQAR